MKRKMVCFILAVCICFFAMGCAENAEGVSSPTLPDAPKGVEGEILNEFVTLKLPPIENPERGQYASYAVEKTTFAWPQTKDVLLQRKELKTEEEIPEGHTCTTSDHAFLTVIEGGNMMFATSKYLEKIDPTVYLQENSVHFNGGQFGSDEDLPFMKQEDAIEEVFAWLSDLKVENMTIEKTYVLDHRQLQKEHDAQSAAGEAETFDKGKNERVPFHIQYTEDDDCYYFILRETLDGINVFSYPHGSPDDDSYVTGASAEIVLSRSGIEYLSVSSHYTVKNREEEQTILPAEQAIQILKNKYDQMILSNPIAVEEMSLLYIPEIINNSKNQFVLTPVWAFDTTEEITVLGAEGNKGKKETYVLINAITGKEIL